MKVREKEKNKKKQQKKTDDTHAIQTSAQTSHFLHSTQIIQFLNVTFTLITCFIMSLGCVLFLFVCFLVPVVMYYTILSKTLNFVTMEN